MSTPRSRYAAASHQAGRMAVAGIRADLADIVRIQQIALTDLPQGLQKLLGSPVHDVNPSLLTLARYAEALGLHREIVVKPL